MNALNKLFKPGRILPGPHWLQLSTKRQPVLESLAIRIPIFILYKLGALSQVAIMQNGPCKHNVLENVSSSFDNVRDISGYSFPALGTSPSSDLYPSHLSNDWVYRSTFSTRDDVFCRERKNECSKSSNSSAYFNAAAQWEDSICYKSSVASLSSLSSDDDDSIQASAAVVSMYDHTDQQKDSVAEYSFDEADHSIQTTYASVVSIDNTVQ